MVGMSNISLTDVNFLTPIQLSSEVSAFNYIGWSGRIYIRWVAPHLSTHLSQSTYTAAKFIDHTRTSKFGCTFSVALDLNKVFVSFVEVFMLPLINLWTHVMS